MDVSCETKPIARSGAPRRCLDCGLRIADRPVGDVRPAACRLWPAEGEMCETNPISAVPRGTGIPSAALSGQALAVSLDHRQDADATIPPDGGTTNLSETPRQLHQTNPIPGEAGWGETTETADAGQSCETNPISAELGRGGRSAAPNKANSRRSDGWGRPSVRNKANQPRQTARNRPNLATPAGGGAAGERKCAKQTQFAPAQRNRWGKPHPARGRNCAKRTQFRRPGRGLGDVTRGANAQNEPNFTRAPGNGRGRPGGPAGDPLRQTNPISGSWPAGGIPSIPVFYHSTILVRCRLCETKPISARWFCLHACRCVCSCSSARLLPNAVSRPPAAY
jgi:hypothetical protein